MSKPTRTTLLARLTEAIESTVGTDTDNAEALAAGVLRELADMRADSMGGRPDDTGDGYPPEHGPWSAEATAADAWETYRELQGRGFPADF